MPIFAPLHKEINSYFDAVLNFLYPPFCVVCKSRLGSGAELVCETCWQTLPRMKAEVSDARSARFFRCLSVWEFSDAMQRIIHEFKFFGKKSLSQPLGDEMAALASKYREYSRADVIVPVPLHKTRLRERGFNQSLLLSQRIAIRLEIPCEPNVLIRSRDTKAQSKLDARQRERNVERAFDTENASLIRGKTVILVDDVMTTGSTLRACARCLIEDGAARILTVTAAKTP